MAEHYEDNFFDGLHNNHTPVDKEIFHKIRDIVTRSVGAEGHDYIPERFEYRVSSIPYCPRKIMYKKLPKVFLNEDQLKTIEIIKDKDRKLNASSAGQLIHEVFQDALIKELGSEKLKMEEEISVEINEAILKGHYDLLITSKSGEEIVIDIKTTTTSRLYLPKQGHLIQLMAYQGILGGIRGAILYVNRNNFELNYYPQEFNKEEYSKLVIKVTELMRYERDEKLPPRIPALPDECGTIYWKCEYYPICYSEEVGDDLEVLKE